MITLAQLRDFRLFAANPSFANPSWEQASPRVLILRLSTFSDVERSTPHVFLAGDIRRQNASAFVDMAFLPQRDDERMMEEAGLPLILGTQSYRPVQEFDVVLVSNSYLLELVNLPFLFSHSGIPLWSRQRDERWPPVILGGSNASAAHALVSEDGDCMVDAIFFGEGENVVGGMVRQFHDRADLPRQARLEKVAAGVDGLWVAGQEAREVHRARCEVGALSAEQLYQPVLPGAEATTARLSITLGCPCVCSFCFEGHDRRPFREIPADSLITAARTLKRETGASTLELSSFNFNTHSELARLLIELNRLFLRVNLMSQRVDILARTPGLLDLELAADKRSFTLGIEGISGRQRRFLRKSLPDADIQRALEALHGHRIREVKLFYILTGRETEEDFAEFARFVKWMKELRRRSEAPPRAVFSFGRLVRMPFTPLRHDPPVLTDAAWRPLLGRAKSICETNGLEFRLSQSWPEYAATQALAMDDPSVADLLVRLSEREGVPEKEVEEWISGRSGQGGDGDQERPRAFSFLETEPSRKSLLRQYLDAKAGKDGAYALSTGRRSVQTESVHKLSGITQAKHKLVPVYREVLLPRETALLGTEWMESWLMRRFLALCPAQTDNVLSIRESLLAPSEALGADIPWFGRSVAAVTAWDLQSFAEAASGVPELFDAERRHFVPGSWTDMRVSLWLPAAHFPRPADRLAEFLRDSHAPVTIRRNGDAFTFVVPEKSARRKAVLSGSGAGTDEGATLELSLGAKFRLEDFLVSFGSRSASRGALTEVLSVR